MEEKEDNGDMLPGSPTTNSLFKSYDGIIYQDYGVANARREKICPSP